MKSNSSNKKIQNLINHIVFVVDASGSMQGRDTVKVFDNQIKHLAKRSQELDQETRVSVYLFNNTTKNLIYDMDVMRLPSLANHYVADGGTALIDGTMTAISELEETPQRHGDHAFLMFVLTDGEENQSRKFRATDLSKRLNNLADNWTVGALVPDANGIHEAKKAGFIANNITVWSTTAKDGIEKAGESMRVATESFMQGRSSGVRSTRNLFTVDTSNLTKSTVKTTLAELKPGEYDILPVQRDAVIKPFITSWMGSYTPGSVYYQLVKTEEVQNYKQICVQDRANGKVYSGLNARNILGLPQSDIKVKPGQFGQYEIFVQSCSVNRKLPKGTKVIVLK